MNDNAETLRDSVAKTVNNYFADLGATEPTEVYELVVSEIEEPLLRTVLDHCRGNQSKAAIYLGLSRGTLRKKLKQFDMI